MRTENGIEFDVGDDGVTVFDMDDHCCIRLTMNDLAEIFEAVGKEGYIKHQKARGRIAE